jgi:hypothetical protein
MLTLYGKLQNLASASRRITVIKNHFCSGAQAVNKMSDSEKDKAAKDYSAGIIGRSN